MATNGLLDIRAVAQLLDVHTRTVRRMADAGRMPRPLKVGRLVRWRAGDVADWIDRGCPAVRSVTARPADHGGRMARDAARNAGGGTA